MILVAILMLILDIIQLLKWGENIHESFNDPRPALVEGVWEEPRYVYLEIDPTTFTFL